jgi:photosystem II stability/assembly factor-like uncharacterized protein
MADEEFVRGARARRAVGLIAVASTVVVVAGLTWLRLSAPAPRPVFPVPSPTPVVPASYSATYDFISPSIGWAAVTSNADDRATKVFKTTDGSRHWQQIYAGTLAAAGAEIHFLDRTHGYIASPNQLGLFRTSDGGVHWKVMSLPSLSGEVTITIADWMHAWFLKFDGQTPNARFYLYSTEDGGVTWSQRAWPNDAFPMAIAGRPGLLFRPGGEGWTGSSGEMPFVYSTSDGGGSWRAHAIAVSASDFPQGKGAPPGMSAYSVAAQILPKSGVIAFVRDYNGDTIALTSFNEGVSWRTVKAPPGSARFEDITFLDAGHWWAWRSGFLYKTSDAGATWNETKVGPLLDNWNYSPAHVIDAEHAWSSMTFIAKEGVSALSMTTDGGASWNPVNVPNPG